MKQCKISFLFLFLGIVAVTNLFAQKNEPSGFNCFSILAGKNATKDGSVMFAHNEDDWGERIVNWYKVPAQTHRKGEMITLRNGGELPKSQKTYAYIWLEMQEMEFSDSYMNEWGVTISSNACMSREKKGELTDGGIGYWLRRAMVERAKSAREAVKIGGALIEKYGYSASGRTYCIAGSREAWLLAVVQGKQWVAQRVPDDHIAIIPNYYTISIVDLSDTINFYGSEDLIEYAEKKKWYNSEKESVFNFRNVYGDPKNLKNMNNIVRHWSAINIMSSTPFATDDVFPFSFKPESPITLTVLFNVLRNHNENTEYDKSNNYKLGHPHKQGRTICSNTTQYGFVAQIRNNLPKEIGSLLWIAPFRPCVHPFTQWYVGMDKMPENFAVGEFQIALDNHFEPVESPVKFAKEHNFLKFVKHAQAIDRTYGKKIKLLQPQLLEFEQKLIRAQKSFEGRVTDFHAEDPKHASKMMSDYSSKQIEKALNMIGK